MSKATCSEPECSEEIFCRDFCRRHYSKAQRAGTLPPRLDAHSLSNIDHDARTADCTICGPQIRIKVRTRTKPDGNPYVATVCLATIAAALRRRRARTGCKPSANTKLRRRKIKLADYDRMYADQKGMCAICFEDHPVLAIDHDHGTGAVRGLLCMKCNIALGWLRDRPDLAISAAKYLRAAENPAA